MVNSVMHFLHTQKVTSSHSRPVLGELKMPMGPNYLDPFIDPVVHEMIYVGLLKLSERC